jgi:glycosyltransferase involved in cell wall biosynthesis
MKIGISVLTAGRDAGGPETYEVQLIRHLACLDRQNQYFVYCTHQEAIRAIDVQQENIRYRLLRPSCRWISVLLDLPVKLYRDQVDLLHATFTPPPLLIKPLVHTVHCVSSIIHPEFYPASVRWRLNKLLKLGIRRARHLICVSGTTRNHLQELFQVPAERTSVIYNGVSPIFSPVPEEEAHQAVISKYNLRGPYFLFVGKLETRKNLQRILQAFSRYRKTSAGSEKLVLVGKRSASFPGIDELIHSLGIQEDVLLLGYVPAGDLPSLYSAARLFVFPSCWEGFGIPILEAMSCGVPVLTSSRTCLPEIAGDAALIVDPESVEEIAEGMAQIAFSYPLRGELIRRGLERAKAFDWGSCARQTLEVYSKVGTNHNDRHRNKTWSY